MKLKDAVAALVAKATVHHSTSFEMELEANIIAELRVAYAFLEAALIVAGLKKVDGE